MPEEPPRYSFNATKLVPDLWDEPFRYNVNNRMMAPPSLPEEPSKYSFNYTKVVPGMPENASLGAYGNVSVNTARGLPDISFPLYTLSKGGVSVPISIAYDASGIKYNDVPSAVGLKWSLNAGGSINRSVNGIVDEDFLLNNLPMLDDAAIYNRNLHINSHDQQDSAKQIAKGNYDVSLDNYYYNFPGHSGSMYLGKNKTFRPDKEYTHLQISYTTSYPSHLDAFQVKDDAGNTYVFANYIDNSTVYNTGHYNKQALSSFSAPVAWKLYQIITATGQTITFTYTPYYYEYMTLDSERWTTYIMGGGSPYAECGGAGNSYIIGYNEDAYTSSRFVNTAWLPSKITTDDQEVLFTYTDDSVKSIFKKQLSAIKVYSKISGDTIRKFTFAHDHNNLTGFSETDPVTNSQVKNHTFAYAGQTFDGDTYSKKRDIFGYYNGASNTTLIANPAAVANYYPYSLANRHVNPNAITGGMLRSVTYPTGGMTQFFFEYNHETFGTGELYAPGVRLRSVWDTDRAGITNKKNFYYRRLAGGISYADMALVNEPNANLEVTMVGIWYSDRIDDIGQGNYYYQQVTIENVGDGVPGSPRLYETDFYTGQPELYGTSPTLIKKNVYLNDTLHLQKTTDYIYDEVDFDSLRIQTYTMRKALARYGQYAYENDPESYLLCPPVTIYQGYDIKAALLPRLFNLHTVVTKEFPTTGDSLVTTVQNQYYTYPVYLQRTDQTGSAGKVNSVRYTYPFNYTTGTPAAMASAFLQSPVITEEYLVNNVLTTKKENFFSYYSPGFYMPGQQKITDVASNTSKTFEFYNYNAKGHVLSQGRTLDLKSSYIYDYLDELPVAEVVNADPGSIAFTSFEADGKGNWSFSGTPAADANALTGGKTYSLSLGVLSKGALSNPQVYTVSYWSKGGAATITGTLSGWPKIVNTATVNGQNWTCYEHQVSGQSTITLNGTITIDEVSLRPRDAMMTTYTYRPLTGVSSGSNNNYRLSYYDYDNMGRLEYVRDDKGHILKKIAYSYTTQPGSSTYANDLVFRNIIRNDCGTGLVGTAVLYSIPAGTYASNTSIEQVSLQLEADFNTLGQAFANANGSCVVPCDTHACRLEGHKCVFNVCENGIKVYTNSVFDQITGKFTCTYHYEFSDFSWSDNYTEETSFGCPGF